MAGGDPEPTVDCGPLNDPNDLMHSIKGMYRILDLISEIGSGGLGAVHLSGLVCHPLNIYNSGKGHHRPRIIETFRQRCLSWGLCLLDKDRLSGT